VGFCLIGLFLYYQQTVSALGKSLTTVDDHWSST